MSATAMDTEFSLQWADTIDKIGAATWRECFGDRDVLQSFELHQAVEQANLEGVKFHYLVVEGDGQVKAVVPCFEFRTSLTVLASSTLRKHLDGLRKVWPNFLYLRVFVAGTPIAICKDLLGIPSLRSDRPDLPLLRQIGQAILARAQALRIGLVLLKEITSSLLPAVSAALSPGFFFAESLPTAYLFTSEPGGPRFSQRLRTKHRVTMNRRLRRFHEAGLRWEITTHFARYSHDFHRLYGQVLERSKVHFEALTPAFFERVSENLGARSFALLCFRGERLVAFELFLEDGDWLHPVYLGMDYTLRDEASLYFNCLYRIIEEAEARGFPVVQLGQTSYEVKSALGAVIDRLYLGIQHRNRLLNRILQRFRSTLFPPTAVPRHRPFTDMQGNHEGLLRYRIPFEE